MALILPTIGRFAARSSEKLAAGDHAFELVADRTYSAFFGEAGVLRDDGVGLVAEFGHGLHQ